MIFETIIPAMKGGVGSGHTIQGITVKRDTCCTCIHITAVKSVYIILHGKARKSCCGCTSIDPHETCIENGLCISIDQKIWGNVSSLVVFQ